MLSVHECSAPPSPRAALRARVSRRGAMGEIVFLLDATRAKRNAKLTYFQCAAHETASRCYTALFCSSPDCTNCGLCLAVLFPSPSTIHMTTSPLAVS